MQKQKAIFNWSGGKDSALALYHILQNPSFEVSGLQTTVNEKYGRISMHGVRRSLLMAQGEALGLPVHEIILPEMPSMDDYDAIMVDRMQALVNEGVTHSIFGDIFLEDLRQYRDAQMKANGMTGVYPLWKRNTHEVIREFLALGFKTVVVCAKAELLNDSFVGRTIDEDFLADLPEGVDPCGENGEFHTFVYDGPLFKQSVPFSLGEKVFRSYVAPKEEEGEAQADALPMGFWFCDLLPG